MFKENDNQDLVGKPKFFFIQACRGDSLDHGELLKCSDTTNNNKEELLIPTRVDQLVGYATSQGSSALRDSKSGSWLIQELCVQIDAQSKIDFLSMLTKVVRKIAISKVNIYQPVKEDEQLPFTKLIGKQGAVIVSKLTKQIFFESSNTHKDDDTGRIL